MLGLSATPYRRDKLTRLIGWYIGDTAHRIDQKVLTESGAILAFRVKWISTQFTTDRDPSNEYSKMLSELTMDTGRNALVCQEAAQQAKTGEGIPLVLSDRRMQCMALADALERDFDINPLVLTGDLSKKARESVVEKLNAGKGEALVATSQLVGEGFDLPALGSVILASPMKFKGRLIQAVGRGLRPSPGQSHATIVDFVDSKIGVFEAAAKSRMRTYQELGAK